MMHIVSTLEEGRAALRGYSAGSDADSGGKPSPLRGGLGGGLRSLSLTHHAPSPLATLDPLPQGERVAPASRAESILHLCSPPFAACHAGVNYYRHLVDALEAEFPTLTFTFTLCCGDDAAIAHDARRLGLSVILNGVKDRVENVSPDPSLHSG